jgi:hypothetical protein
MVGFYSKVRGKLLKITRRERADSGFTATIR